MVTKLKTFKEFLREGFQKKRYQDSIWDRPEEVYEGKSIHLSKEGKFYKFFKLKDRYKMKRGVEEGADLVRKKGYKVIFDFDFPFEIFAVLYEITRNDTNKKYAFYELTTGRMVLHESEIYTAESYFEQYKTSGKSKRDYDEWLKDRFEENEKYFGVKGKVN